MTYLETNYIWIGAVAAALLAGLALFDLRRRLSRLRAFTRQDGRLSEARSYIKPISSLVLIPAAVVLMALSLAGPLGDPLIKSVHRRALDLLFVVDTSRSMLASDGDANRLDLAVREIRGLLRGLRGERVGLIAFTGAPKVICPLTYDLSGFSVMLDTLHGYSVDEGGTALGPAIQRAVELLRNDSIRDDSIRQRAVILATDGEDLTNSTEALSAAASAGEAGISIYTVLFGGLEGAPVPDKDALDFVRDADGKMLISRPDPVLLRRIADAGNGMSVAGAHTAYPMDWLYQHHLSNLDTEPVQDQAMIQRRNQYQNYLLAALACWLLALFLPRARRLFRAGGTWSTLFVFLAGTASALPADEDPFREGVRLFQAREYEEAQHCFERALAEKPNDPDLLVNSGLAWMRQNEFGRAAACFDRVMALEECPAHDAALFGGAITRYRMGEIVLRRFDQESGIEKPGEGETLDLARLRSMLERADASFRLARNLFASCEERGAWPEAAMNNRDCADRKLVRIGQRLETLEAAISAREVDPRGEGKTESGNAGEGSGAEATGGTSGNTGPETAGTAESGGTGTKRFTERHERMSLEEKRRIYSILDALRQERIEADRAAARLKRRSMEGIDL